MSTLTAAGGPGLGWLRLSIELSVLLIASVAAAAVAWFVPGVREWLTATLGFGWAAVGAFGMAALLALLHWPSGIINGWRWWLTAALVVGILVVGVSFVRGDAGTFYTYGMAGQWGYALTGGSVGIAALEFIAALALIGLLVIPDGGRWYWAALRYAGVGAWAALVATTAGLRVAGVWLFAATATATRSAVSIIGRRKQNGATPKPPKPKKPRPAAPEPDEPEPAPATLPTAASRSGWQLPPLDILAPAEEHQMDHNAIAEMSEEIKEALAEHRVYVDVEDVKAGPRVIRFGLVPGYIPQQPGREGAAKPRPSRVRVSDITKQQKDLALALKSPYIRIIETPEPGEGLVGLEVPNPSPGKVLMRSIVGGQDFGKIVQKGGLAFAWERTPEARRWFLTWPPCPTC